MLTSVVFRKLRHNHFSLAVLVGLLDEVLDARAFRVSVAPSGVALRGEVARAGRVVVAYSFCTPEQDEVRSEVASLRSLERPPVIVAGGPHASALPDEVLSWGVDAVFTGEAEESLPAWLRAHAAGTTERGSIRPRPLRDLDAYPPFAASRRLFAPIELRRGCACSCSFCFTPRLFATTRERSVGGVLRHAEAVRRAGGRRINFIASDALSFGAPGPHEVSLDALESLLSGVAALGLNPSLGYFPSEVSARSLARCPEAARMLRRYVGNRELVIGAQSGSARTLRRMRRGHGVEESEAAVAAAREGGFVPLVDILLATPGEEAEERQETVAWMERLRRAYGARFNLHLFMPLPGTPFAGMQPEVLEPEVMTALRRLEGQGAVRGRVDERVGPGPS